MKNIFSRLTNRIIFKGLTLEERMQLSKHIQATFNSPSGKVTLKYMLYASGLTNHDETLSDEKALLIREGMQRLTKTMMKHSVGDIEELLAELKVKTEKQLDEGYNYTGVDPSEEIE